MKNIEKFKTGYESAKYEKDIYKKWDESGFFNPDNLKSENILKEKIENKYINENGEEKNEEIEIEKTFTCILPPPNVTGTLHTGHAIMLAIQDTVVRWKRMQGYRTLWLPGTDHAAIATQSKVEAEIKKKEGKSRHDLGREELFKRVNDFAMDSQATILSQFKDLGASLDWSRLAFTLDDKRNLSVNTMFKKMYDDGLIYRGNRIVNWDPKGQTTISDDEIVTEDRKSILYTFKYSKDFPIAISTTRPETKVGDTAVAVHPDDERYKEFVGKEYELEFAGCPIKIKIIADTAVEKEFGTGALGVTPAHSQIDWEIADRHDLERKQVINEYAKIFNVENPDLLGKKVADAREYIVNYLKENNLLIEEKEVDQAVPTAERTGGIIEPLPKLQWWIAVNKEFDHFGKKTTLKNLMLAAVDENNDFEKYNNTSTVKMLPERFEKVYTHWINNLNDWCISRQIWYGHRVPVWYDADKNIVSVGELKDEYKNNTNIIQDEDTLDTWFSSGMWTFSTLGWPENTSDLQKYHPTQLLETGHDIIFFWVARMILMSTYALNQIPFETAYFHGLVRDTQGRKMSKSLGNVLDPRDLTVKYGTDALRMALIVGNGPGNDLKLGEDKIKAYKNFANKVWNATRFVLEKTEDYEGDYKTENLLESDAFLIKEMNEKIKDIDLDLENYRLHLASEKIYDYFWHVFCDKYIEDLKNRIINNENKTSAQATLLIMLRRLIITLHPFMPFITEEIWDTIKDEDDNLLMITKW